MTALGAFVLVHDDGRGLRFLRPHHLGRREQFERPSLTPDLSAAFIFPSASHARVALEIVRGAIAGWPALLDVRELALAPIRRRGAGAPRHRVPLYDLELVSVDGGEPCTWAAFKRTNIDMGADRLAEIEREIVDTGRYDESGGASAGFVIELVRPVIVDGATS